MQVEDNRSVESEDVAPRLEACDVELSDKGQDGAFGTAGSDDDENALRSGPSQSGNRARRDFQLRI